MAPISVIKTPTTFRIILIISVPSQLTSLSVHLYVTAGKLGTLARHDRARRLRVGFCHESWRVLSLIVAGIVTNSDNHLRLRPGLFKSPARN